MRIPRRRIQLHRLRRQSDGVLRPGRLSRNKYDADVTVIFAPFGEDWALKIAAIPRVRVVESDRLDPEAFIRAGIQTASAIGLLDQNDASNVDAALIAQELNPELRVVIRMFNVTLGERIAKLLNDCVVLSAARSRRPRSSQRRSMTRRRQITIGGRTLTPPCARTRLWPTTSSAGLR